MQQKYHRKKLKRTLIVVQVVVVFCLVAVIFGMFMLRYYASHQYEQAAQRLLLVDSAPASLAESIRVAQDMQFAAENYIASHYPIAFDPTWTTQIVENLPPFVQLLSFEFIETLIVLTAVSRDLSDISVHRQQLDALEIFAEIQQGQIIRLDDGRMRYELRLQLQNE